MIVIEALLSKVAGCNFLYVDYLSLGVNTFGLIKAVSDIIFDMIVTTYHDKPLIFSRAT